MGITHGVAGVAGMNPGPEEPGIFLADDEWEVEWFAEMAISSGHPSVDLWEITLPGEPILSEGEGGYSFLPEPVPRDSIRLIRKDWTPESRFDE